MHVQHRRTSYFVFVFICIALDLQFFLFYFVEGTFRLR